MSSIRMSEEDVSVGETHTWVEPDLYLMADEQIIADSRDCVRRVCQIEKNPQPVIVPDKPWEGLTSNGELTSLQDPLYSTVLFDPEEKVFRCWYNVYDRFVNRENHPPMANQGSACCYAVSSDGVNWEKPIVGRVLHDGSYENNIVRFMEQSTPGTCVLAEQVWNVIPISLPGSDDRFAASLYTHYDDEIYSKGITFCFSPDGITWRMEFPPAIPIDGDCHSVSLDPIKKCYLATTRSAENVNLSRRWGRPWKRHIALSKSRDLVNWTPMHTVLETDDGDPEDAQLYLMYIIPYGHAYLGQLLVIRTSNMTLENQLTLSRDMEHWQRVGDHQPILSIGPEGSWDSKHVALSNNLPHPEGDRMRFWYGGKSSPHYQAGYGALGTGTLRKDGFVCWEAGDKEAVLTTIPFKPTSATWVILNVDASDGEALVEVIDENGNPIDGCAREDCVPIRGDHIRAVVNFRAEESQLFLRGNFMRFGGQPIRFRFYLRNAKLYAFKSPNLEPVWPKDI